MGIIKVSEIPVSSFIENLQLVKRAKGQKKRKGERDLIEIVCAFDIETTTVWLPDPEGPEDEKHPHSFMYVWQFQLGPDITLMGRTWQEFNELREVLGKISNALWGKFHTHERPRFVTYVHNLAFEWQFLQGVYEFLNEDCFFRDVRQPIYCELDHLLLFRCSYLNSNMTLEKFAENMGCTTKKLDGTKFDYSKIRFPWTELTEYEVAYATHDVIALEEAIRLEMQKDGDTLLTIPLTSTGYVRRDCKEALKPNYYSIKQILPDLETYNLLQRCFRGGNTHANRWKVGQVLGSSDTGGQIHNGDIASSYPTQQLTKLFPMGQFRKLEIKDNTIERIKKLIEVGNAVIADYCFKNVKLKDKRDPMPYLAIGKCHSLNAVEDNGRILRADVVVTALTEIDLFMVLEQYDIERVSVYNAMTAIKGPLPIAYRNVILNYFKAKTELKGIKSKEYEYNKMKNKLNGIYGMSAQRPIHPLIYYSEHKFFAPRLPDPEEREKELANAPFPYQWGVYTTAYARMALHDGLQCIGKDKNGMSLHIYSDTDSIKFQGPKNIFDTLNKRLRAAAVKAGAVFKDAKGKSHYIGEWELEDDYDSFITQGAKRYAAKIGDEIKVTISGVTTKKEKVLTSAGEEEEHSIAGRELGALENLKDGFTFVEAGGLTARYNDEDNFDYTDPETGAVVHITPNVSIIPKTYHLKLTEDYKEIVEQCAMWCTYCMEKGRVQK